MEVLFFSAPTTENYQPGSVSYRQIKKCTREIENQPMMSAAAKKTVLLEIGRMKMVATIQAIPVIMVTNMQYDSRSNKDAHHA